MKTNRVLASVVTLVMIAAAVFLGFSGRPVSRDDSLYLTDKAGVISQSDAQAFLARQQNASPRLSVAVVKSTGRVSIGDYCISLWNQWHLGTSDLLLLLVTGDQDYYFGYDWNASFAGVLDQSYQNLLDRYLEPDFTAGDYGRAILTFSDGVQAALAGGIMSEPGGTAWMVEPSSYGHGGTGRITLLLVAIVAVILLIAVVSASSIGRRSRYRGRAFTMMPPPSPRRRSRTIMPPPPPGPRPGRPVRPPQPPRMPSRPASRPSSFGRGGFTGGGRSSGGFTGGGRSAGGFRGGGRSGGGMGGGGRSGGMRGGGKR